MRGFSLVELSIVLVILGLLTGGILAGQNLIRASELRAISTEFQSFVAATQTFRDKYFALPGDMRNATDFWGTMTNCAAGSPSGSGTETCDGDGDGIIENAGAASQTGELYGFWKQLSNAGLVEGSYTGIAGPSSPNNSVIRENVPPSKLTNAGWTMLHWNHSSGSSTNFAYDFGNHFSFGAQGTNTTVSSALTPEEAWNVDTKMDDGISGSGAVIAVNRTACTLSSSATDYGAAYDLLDTTTVCALRFMRPF